LSKWYIYNKKKNYINNLKLENISKLEALILGNRDILDHKVLDMFIDPSLDKLHDPFLLPDMKEAIDLIIKTMSEGKNIRIFGDYDQDGISSVMTLLDGLLYFYDQISYDIPDRVLEGYGISDFMVDKAIEDGVSLVITCDNGITAFDQIKRLKENKISVIVTDHHQIEKISKDDWVKQNLPQADCVINPKRLDSNYPFDDLCGAGVAFKLIQALFERLEGDKEYLYSLLEYVAMGTVCDMVSLTDENRIFVVEGLKRLNNTDKLGIESLLRENSWNKEVDTYTLGFVIGPCMNASGRLSSAKLAVKLLTEEDYDKIEEYAKEIVSLNNERKALTEKGLKDAIKQIEEKEFYKDDVIVILEEDIDESICGIVAGRIKEKYNRPTIVLAKSANQGILKGSGRSIEAYNIYKEVFKFQDKLESFGGHPMACGLSIKEERLEEFREFLNKESTLNEEDFIPIINIDARIPLEKLSLEFAQSIKKMEPFGKDISRPIFADKNVKIANYQLIGKNSDTLKIVFEAGGHYYNAIKFNGKEEFAYLDEKLKNNNGRVDIVYFPDINEFRGRTSLQLRLIDLR
jgi:single-stranded-DNA-specific exonuclease